MIFVFDDEQRNHRALTTLWQGRKIFFKNFSWLVDGGWYTIVDGIAREASANFY
jgi:hypothetical protein